MQLNRVYCKDCRTLMKELDSDFVDLIITSPPYNCGRNYADYNDKISWPAYWDFTREWLTDALRIAKSGGRLAVNLPWWMEKKPRRSVPFEFQKLATEIGWLFLDKIIWIKGNEKGVHTSGGWGGNGSGWGTYMSPSGPSIRCASEPILIFAKNTRGRKVISGEGKGKCVKGDITKEEWLLWTLDTWFINGESDKDHPAVFPLEIPKRLIKLYTYIGDLIYDPFIGRGTTTLAAQRLRRNFIGSDISKEYCNLANRRSFGDRRVDD